jgi:hypothetical protein
VKGSDFVNSSLLELFSLVIPIASVFVSYSLGQRQSERKYEREQAKLRYDSFYVPLFQFFYAGRMADRPGSSLRFDARCKLLDMFTHNLSMIGPGLQSCYPDLLIACTAMLNYESNELGYEHAPNDFDRVFKRIEKFAIAESKELSSTLRLPPIAQAYEMELASSNGSKPRLAKSKSQSHS